MGKPSPQADSTLAASTCCLQSWLESRTQHLKPCQPKRGENHGNATSTTAGPQGRWTQLTPAPKNTVGSKHTVVSNTSIILFDNTFYQKRYLSQGGYLMQIMSVEYIGWIGGAVVETGYSNPFIHLCKEHIRRYSRVYRLSICASKALSVLFHVDYLSDITFCILWILNFNKTE